MKTLKDLTLSDDQLRRRTMAVNLCTHNWSRNRGWAISFGRNWAREQGFDPDNFHQLLLRTGIEMGHGTDNERRQAREIVDKIPSCKSDHELRRRALALCKAFDLPELAVEAAIDLTIKSRRS